jgi:thimet oligopeptidase
MKYTQLTSADFAWVKMSEKQILSFPVSANKSIQNKLNKIKSLKKEDRTFENTVKAYETANDEESSVFHQITLLGMVSDKKNIRDAARKAEVEFSKYAVDIAYDEDIYKALKEYHSFNYKKEKKNLDDQDIKLLSDIMLGFKRLGFDLPEKSREKLKKIDKTCSELGNEYDARISENTDHILCTMDELDGVPEMIVNSFEKVGDKYKVTLQYPEYGPFIRYAKNRKKREELYKLFNNTGGTKNVAILKQLAKLRAQRATLLGYDNHAAFKLEVRMAKNEANVYKMKYDLVNSLKTKVAKDYQVIKSEANKLGYKELRTHDTAFITNIIRERDYALDEQKVREYFELNNVMSFMFGYFGELFGFEILESSTKLWHKDAKLFELKDKKSKQVISYMAVDLHPREGKYGHACMMPMIEGQQLGKDSYRSPFAVLICNFPKSTKAVPSLLNIGEVETLFHEFGHGLHALLTEAKYTTHAGTNVVWDFVEMPSQIMEQWVVEEGVLKKMTKHYKTGNTMPSEMIKQIISTNNLFQSIFYTRQSVQGLLDMDIYTGKAADPVKHFHKLMSEYLIPESKGVLFVSRFSHIIGGYDAGYYSYLWAERLSHDAFSIFKRDGLNNKKVGAKYRKEILAAGSSRDEKKSIEAFLGRKISNKAFLSRLK